ncbi:MAG: chromosome segregation protein SMC [Chloroherpetonaceae bacterium]|nr:chromosome segregation protein SMC [Chloroherpetonaceae bacterium]
MRLKKLALLGFKTFADRTEIEIGDGLTAIVGPNGSGKSNIVDALLWVMGEQNPRLLRGTSAQDVIFAGSEKRKPLGMAEVRLTIDNTTGTIPLGFSEVTVARRVYRSGESEYRINGAPARLKDIVELFLDTGAGRGAYAVVGQNEIDAVLSARPEDRRALFEEAAGIQKYRTRKKEALRKLEAAEANLNRVRDILQELEAQRVPMEQQAQVARRYLLLQERLREIEVGLLVSEVKTTDYEIYAARQEQTENQQTLLQLDAQLAQLERTAEELGEQLAQAESDLEAVRIAQQNALSQVERMESRMALLTERAQSGQRSREHLDAEIRETEERITTLHALIAADIQEQDATAAEETARTEEWLAQKAILQELEAAVQEARRQQEEQQSERLRQARERAGREAALQAAQDRCTDLETRAEHVGYEVAELAAALQEVETRQNAVRATIEAQEARCREQEQRRNHIEQHLHRIQHHLTEIRSALEAARRQLAEQTARLATLTELQENHEGFYQGVRAVLNAHRKGELPGHYRTVVDLLTVPERYRIAIEVALGASLQDIVTLTEAEARAGIAWLKRHRAGRATFLPLPLLRPAPELKVTLTGGDVGANVHLAMHVVTLAPEYTPVARLLLGRVLIAPDMDTAIALSRQLSGWSRIVTLEGEVLTPGGALTGGSLHGRGAHLVGRKGEIDDLRTLLPETRATVERLTAQAEATLAQLRQVEAEQTELARQEAEARTELAAASSALTAMEREHHRLTQEHAERTRIYQALRAEIAALRTEIAQRATQLASDRTGDAQVEDASALLAERTQALLVKRDACRARAIALEVEVGRLREKREGLARALSTDQANLALLEQQLQQKRTQRMQADAACEASIRERATLQHQLEEARQHLVRVESELARQRERRQERLDCSFETTRRIKEVAQQRNAVTRELHAIELRLARLEVQRAQALQRLQEEYQISHEEALASPEEIVPDRNTAIEVNRLRREIRSMGQVNTGAVAEYERLTERYEFLSTQHADLERGREALLATIAEIDASTRGVFMETFHAVRKEFERLFHRLFDGGHAHLELTCPEDPLESGIEVTVQPPGKKARHLSLLSGGERALTATALLFAFLAVRPSPFVVLDEVDAPLDGANVEKFIQLVREFSERSQFLLITHNPATMEAAPRWYGVTMAEPGVSRILAYRVPQEALGTGSSAGPDASPATPSALS